MNSSPFLRLFFISLAALLVVVALAAGVMVAHFDPNSLKPRIAAAIRSATGRDVTLDGPVRLALVPRPAVTLNSVGLANPPGFATPRMATLRAITLHIDPWALLRRRVILRQLLLDRPEMVLERNAAGTPNWRFTPPPTATRPAPTPAPSPAPVPPPAPPSSASSISSPTTPFAVLDARIRDGVLTYRDDRTGQVLVLAIPNLSVSAATPDAPAHLVGEAVLDGTRFALHADTGPLSGPGTTIWPVRANLTAEGPGGTIALALAAPAADQPLHIAVQGTLRGTPIAATAALPAPDLLTGTQPVPVSLQAQAAGAQLSASGTIAQPTRLAGVDLALVAAVPDLATLSPLAGRALPGLRGLSASARLSDRDGLRNGLALRDLHVAGETGDLAGTLDVAFAPRPMLRADLSGTRLDLAALHAAAARSPSPSPAPPSPPASPPAAQPPLKAGASAPVIPDTPLPFAALRAGDADIRLRLATVQAGAESLRGADAHLTLANGVLSVAVQGAFAAAPVSVTATAEAASTSVTAALAAPALPLASLLAGLGQRAYATGTLAIVANLHGAGASPHAIAAGLDGFAAVSMRGGTIQTQVLEHALGPAIARANPLALLGTGDSAIDCLALRGSASHGTVQLAPLLLSSSLITVDGTGRADLAAETLDLHLHAQGRAGGLSLAVPLTVTGGFRKPRVTMAQSAARAAGLQVLDLLAGKGRDAPQPSVSCAGALAAARG